MVGATPLLSAAFHDEPTIETLNLLRMDVTSVGNHEFDEGVDELLRLQNGGCHPTDGCQDGDPFDGADFPYLAANTVYKDTGKTILPAYTTAHGAGRQGGLHRDDARGHAGHRQPGRHHRGRASSTRSRRPTSTPTSCCAKGVEAIVLLIHEGGPQSAPPTADRPVGLRQLHRRAHRRSSPGWTPSSTWSSPATRTGPTSARCPTRRARTSWPPAPAPTASWSPTSRRRLSKSARTTSPASAPRT